MRAPGRPPARPPGLTQPLVTERPGLHGADDESAEDPRAKSSSPIPHTGDEDQARALARQAGRHPPPRPHRRRAAPRASSTQAIACAAQLTDASAPGGRVNNSDPRPPPTLAWIPIYVLPGYYPPAPGTWTSHGN